jgi:RND family efflux transporter MFP subunit
MVHKLLMASFGLVLVLSGCSDKDKTAANLCKMRADTQIVQHCDFPEVDSEPGSVISDDRVELSSHIVGFIKKLDVREGQRVKKGEILVQLDPSNVIMAIQQAQAGVDAAKRDLTDAEHDQEAFSAGAAEGWASTDAKIKAQVRRDISKAALIKAEAALTDALAQQAYATITSPVSGVVVARHKQCGDMATTGAPILTIESREVLLFKTFVAESIVGKIGLSMPVDVSIDALASRVVKGSVQRIIPSGDPVTRRYEVDVALPVLPDILPGMFGRAEFVLGGSQCPAIPKQALVRRGGLDGVFVVGEDNTARFRWLRVGRERNGLLEVTAGLSEGERIVSLADNEIKDGMLIASEGKD